MDNLPNCGRPFLLKPRYVFYDEEQRQASNRNLITPGRYVTTALTGSATDGLLEMVVEYEKIQK
jgi:hypothetical protein